MNTKNQSFPHPVMGNGDDVSSLLTIDNLRIGPTPVDTEIRFRITTDDRQLIDLVNKGDVEPVMFWHCRTTLTSELEKLVPLKNRQNGWEYEVFIDQEKIRDEVGVSVEMIAARNLQNFHWSNQHPDYGSSTFDVRAGDYVALPGSFKFKAAKLFDAMNPPLSSFFDIIVDPKIRGHLEVDFDDDDQIRVRISEHVKEKLLHTGMPSSLKISLVVLPALIETLAFMEKQCNLEHGEDLTNRSWYVNLLNLLPHRSLTEDGPLKAAMHILREPYLEALSTTENEELEADNDE
ncbi:hypothetical protein [Corynebacterium auriscanis]|uniref:hypothetical protein n=1 Tax=Corynebacterium auriscanis TaxID=99807 RepID=UPI003CEA8877